MGRLAGVNMTKATVETLEPKAAMYRVPDSEVRGLNLQVTPAGVKSWILRYCMNGRRNALTLGRWPEMTVSLARKKATALLAKIGKDEDPAAERREERAAKTVKDLAEQFVAEHLPTLKPSSRSEYARILTKRILPALGAMRVKDVGAADVARLLSAIRKSTPKGIEANRTRAVLSKMWSLGAIWGFVTDGRNPARGQMRAAETKKDRHLSDRELVALGATLRHLDPTPGGQSRPAGALPAESAHALGALRLILLTGLRKSEVIGNAGREIPALPWAAVDLDAGTLRLEHHKTARKAGTRIVPLCAAACDLLGALPRTLGNPLVIPGRDPGTALAGLARAWARVKAAVAELQARRRVPKAELVDLADVTIHDLRRSFASLAARLGYPHSFTGALLGHAAGTVTEGYARLGADPLRDAAEVIGGRMADLLEGRVDLEAERKAAKEAAAARRAGKLA